MHAVQGVCEQRHPFASSAAQESMFVDAMKENINWHQEQSPFYRKLLEMKQFDAATLTSIDDLASIPFVPATFFKSHELLSVARDDIKLHLTSSGTTGQKSQVSFDAWSLSAGQKMIDAVFEHFGWNTPDVKTNYLLYSYETASDSQLGTAHTDNFLCKYAPVASAFYALRRTGAPTTATGGASHEFDVFGCIEKLQHYAAEGLPVRIFGFPAFLFFTLKRMRELGLPPLKLSADSLVFLGGGWKGKCRPGDRQTRSVRPHSRAAWHSRPAYPRQLRLGRACRPVRGVRTPPISCSRLVAGDHPRCAYPETKEIR